MIYGSLIVPITVTTCSEMNVLLHCSAFMAAGTNPTQIIYVYPSSFTVFVSPRVGRGLAMGP
jgi:hypothetical protein